MTGVSLEFRWPCLLLRGSKKSYHAYTHTRTLRLGRGRQSSSRETERKVGQHLEDKTALNTRTLACGQDVRVHSCSKTEKKNLEISHQSSVHSCFACVCTSSSTTFI